MALTSDLYIKILSQLPLSNYQNLCRVGKVFHQLLKDQNYWLEKLKFEIEKHHGIKLNRTHLRGRFYFLSD